LNQDSILGAIRGQQSRIFVKKHSEDQKVQFIFLNNFSGFFAIFEFVEEGIIL